MTQKTLTDRAIMARKLFKFGNAKLPKSTAIFNLTTAHDCPSRKLGLCQLDDCNKCYALRAEKRFPAVLAYRKRQASFWANSTDVEFVTYLLAAIGEREVTALRLNESGDFRHMEDFNKVCRIAEGLKPFGITVYMYTARKDLWEKIQRGRKLFGSFGPKNLVITGSGFMAHNKFKAVKRAKFDADIGKPGIIPCKADCKICSLCLQNKGRTISARMH